MVHFRMKGGCRNCTSKARSPVQEIEQEDERALKPYQDLIDTGTFETARVVVYTLVPFGIVERQLDVEPWLLLLR
jgi:hypothetical protein